MRSHGKGVESATTQVKVLSPEILLIALGQGFHVLEANTGSRVKGERVTGVPGSKSVAGERTVCIGTWENRGVPFRKPPRSRRSDAAVWRSGSRTDSY